MTVNDELYVLCKFSLFGVATKTAVVGRCGNNIIPSIYTFNKLI
jgi:hypothetical protein